MLELIGTILNLTSGNFGLPLMAGLDCGKPTFKPKLIYMQPIFICRFEFVLLKAA
jgi:hypothetical protein